MTAYITCIHNRKCWYTHRSLDKVVPTLCFTVWSENSRQQRWLLVRDAGSPFWISVLLLFDPVRVSRRVPLSGLAIFTLKFVLCISRALQLSAFFIVWKPHADSFNIILPVKGQYNTARDFYQTFFWGGWPHPRHTEVPRLGV